MPRRQAIVISLAAGLSAISACREELPSERHYPMRGPMRGPTQGPTQGLTQGPAAVSSGTTDGADTGATGSDPDARPPLAERPPADPDIERALDLIAASGRSFVDPAASADERPVDYSAEEFAGMLRTKWDWLGYDLGDLDPWLDAIATRSFKTNLPYQVVLDDGTRADFRPWLDAQLQAREARDP